MMNSNKILTVSYGTFSCTLEGFDDSFDTMKAIAEYFRDLAADDRYFGAEPPQPDAEMLARIAEREVARRVEAREHEGRIMLKAHQEPVAHAAPVAAATAFAAPQAAPEPAPAPQPAAGPVAMPDDLDAEATAAAGHVAEPEPEMAEAPADEPVAESEAPEAMTDLPETPVEAAHAPLAAEEVAAEEEETTAEAAAEETAAEETDEAVEAETPFEAQPAEAATTDADDAETAEGAAAFFAESVTADQPDMAAEEELADEFAGYISPAAEADETAAEAPHVFVAEDVTPAIQPASESLADKLQRIRAVVSRRDDDIDDAEYVEDAEEPAASHAFDDLAGDISGIMPRTGASADDSADEEDSAEDAMAEAARDISDAFDADDEDEDSRADAGTDDLESFLRRIETIGKTDPQASENLAEDDEDDAEEEIAAQAGDEAATEDEDEDDNLFARDADASDEDEDEMAHAVDAAEKNGFTAFDLAEYEDDDLARSAELSAEQEEELQRDLASLDAEEEPAAPAPGHAAARDSLPRIDKDTGDDVSRLMAKADQQMQEPEGKTRRSAFAHLRAAVAARFADRSMEEADNKVEEDVKAYRSDLAEVVKPRRPVASDRPSDRPADARPAPLKLVAEQRIDASETMVNRGPVAPRRVGMADMDDLDLSEDTGFAAYAEERGATSLPDLLEAAAAYLSYVEGHDQFSRPQLMSRVRQADCGEFSREDGLRSFGQLLRTGKIEKIKGGRFAASEAIGFKPDHRAAG